MKKHMKGRGFLAISHSKDSQGNQTAVDSNLCPCVRLPHAVIYSLAESPNSIKSVTARHIPKVLQN